MVMAWFLICQAYYPAKTGCPGSVGFAAFAYAFF